MCMEVVKGWPRKWLAGVWFNKIRTETIVVWFAYRCEWRSLLVGVFTALPSGAAVAIAILGENIGSLVGVAISASLLPPAVNSVSNCIIVLMYNLYTQENYNNFREFYGHLLCFMLFIQMIQVDSTKWFRPTTTPIIKQWNWSFMGVLAFYWRSLILSAFC